MKLISFTRILIIFLAGANVLAQQMSGLSDNSQVVSEVTPGPESNLSPSASNVTSANVVESANVTIKPNLASTSTTTTTTTVIPQSAVEAEKGSKYLSYQI